MSTADKLLQFMQFSIALDHGFWHKLTQLKLEVYKTDDKPVTLFGYYSNNTTTGKPSLTVDSSALESSYVTPPHNFTSHGVLRNFNTVEDFQNCDMKELLHEQGYKILEDITSGRSIDDPSLLASFLLVTYADLKKYRCRYMVAFPAMSLPEKITLKKDVIPITQRFSEKQIDGLIKSFDALASNHPMNAFLVQENGDSLEVGLLKDFKRMSSSKVLLGICDPCSHPAYPGWPLRNLLTLAAYHWSDQLGNQIEVICLRDRHIDGARHVSHSIVFNLSLPSIDRSLFDRSVVKYVGWAKNEKQKFTTVVNLSSTMDPVRLAKSAVDLNLKLMKWRLLPDLDIDAISNTKCLLLGSGTLGCNVARCLLGWGVRNITLVDNSCISYSNPVRQSLFVFNDCLNEGQHKAVTAALSLKQIFPGVNAVGIDLSIPMPGHTVPDTCLDQVREDVRKLEDLIEEHDAVFLLMDTRESRWLPTVIGAHKRKIVISAALGFDTYLVVRHGVRDELPTGTVGDGATTAAVDVSAATSSSSVYDQQPSYGPIPGTRLGCYFCNDVVAPGNSTHDRTLDQQCTVSRPGISMMAAAAAVELLTTVLIHPHRGRAAADTSSKDENLTASFESPLGLVPHQIRGFLSRFHVMLPASQAFDKCTACCDKILTSYAQDGFDFLINAFNRPSFLEDVTGLTELHASTADADIYDFSDEFDDEVGDAS